MRKSAISLVDILPRRPLGLRVALNDVFTRASAWPLACLCAMLLFVVGSPSNAQDERATERYAPAQLSVAREFLARARKAASDGDYAFAGSLARQAGVDARLTWAMTDAARLRAQAAAVAQQAAELARAVTALTQEQNAAAGR